MPLPQFPKFKKLSLEDRVVVEKHTAKHYPYSDFNFISLWSWNTDRNVGFSELNGNLIVRLGDYHDGSPVYSLIGHKKTRKTVETVLDFLDNSKKRSEIILVPETIGIKAAKHFQTDLDRDNFDYIYHINQLATYSGRKFKKVRNLATRFTRETKGQSVEIRVIDLGKPKERTKVLQVARIWLNRKTREKKSVSSNELKALRRLIKIAPLTELLCIGVFIDGELRGFCINELLPKRYAVTHFAKADYDFVGIFAYLMQENAKKLRDKKRYYLNFEQDLGIDNLRVSKKSFAPATFLKKFRIWR